MMQYLKLVCTSFLTAPPTPLPTPQKPTDTRIWLNSHSKLEKHRWAQRSRKDTRTQSACHALHQDFPARHCDSRRGWKKELENYHLKQCEALLFQLRGFFFSVLHAFTDLFKTLAPFNVNNTVGSLKYSPYALDPLSSLF